MLRVWPSFSNKKITLLWPPNWTLSNNVALKSAKKVRQLRCWCRLQPVRPGFNPNFHPLWSLNWAELGSKPGGEPWWKIKKVSHYSWHRKCWSNSCLAVQKDIFSALFLDVMRICHRFDPTMNCVQSFTKTRQSDKDWESSSDLFKTTSYDRRRHTKKKSLGKTKSFLVCQNMEVFGGGVPYSQK